MSMSDILPNRRTDSPTLPSTRGVLPADVIGLDGKLFFGNFLTFKWQVSGGSGANLNLFGDKSDQLPVSCVSLSPVLSVLHWSLRSLGGHSVISLFKQSVLVTGHSDVTQFTSR